MEWMASITIIGGMLWQSTWDNLAENGFTPNFSCIYTTDNNSNVYKPGWDLMRPLNQPAVYTSSGGELIGYLENTSYFWHFVLHLYTIYMYSVALYPLLITSVFYNRYMDSRWHFRCRFFIPSNQTFPEASESQQTL